MVFWRSKKKKGSAGISPSPPLKKKEVILESISDSESISISDSESISVSPSPSLSLSPSPAFLPGVIPSIGFNPWPTHSPPKKAKINSKPEETPEQKRIREKLNEAYCSREYKREVDL